MALAWQEIRKGLRVHGSSDCRSLRIVLELTLRYAAASLMLSHSRVGREVFMIIVGYWLIVEKFCIAPGSPQPYRKATLHNVAVTCPDKK